MEQQVSRLRADTQASAERLETSISEVGAAFDWSLSDLVWLAEQTNATLQKVLEVLRAPLDTAARELRKRAERAYGNGWVDEALEDFLESEKKNKYDFSVAFYIANIYYIHRHESSRALEYYEKSAKYAAPESPLHATWALLHKALVHYERGELQDAYGVSQRAMEIRAGFPEGHYLLARFSACVGKQDEALQNLRQAIAADRLYCARASVEPDFAPIHASVMQLLHEVLARVMHQADALLLSCETLLDALGPDLAETRSFLHTYYPESAVTAPTLEQTAAALRKLRERLNQETILGCWEVSVHAGHLVGRTLNECSQFVSAVDALVANREWPPIDEKRTDKYAERLAFVPAACVAMPLTAWGLAAMFRAVSHVGYVSPTAMFVDTLVCAPIGLGLFGLPVWAISYKIARGILTARARSSPVREAFALQKRRLARLKGCLDRTRSADCAKSWREIAGPPRPALGGPAGS